MQPANVALPFIASALFLGAAITALLPMSQASSLAAVTLGALCLLLLILMLRDNATLVPVVAGLATLFFASAIGGWVADATGWSAPVGRMVFILGVMGVLATFNSVRIARGRGKR